MKTINQTLMTFFVLALATFTSHLTQASDLEIHNKMPLEAALITQQIPKL